MILHGGEKIWIFYIRVARTISQEWVQRTSEILFLPQEHKIHILELTCNVLFITVYKHTDDGMFGDFPKLFWRPDKRSRIFSENFRRLPKTFEEDPEMFRWYTNRFKYNTYISEIIDIFTCEDIVSLLSICLVTTLYTTDFYIIKSMIWKIQRNAKFPLWVYQGIQMQA